MSIPVVMRRAIGTPRARKPRKKRALAFLPCSAVGETFQMKECVDKKKESEISVGEAKGERLMSCDLFADNDFAMLRTDGIGEDVRRIRFAAPAPIFGPRRFLGF